MIIIIISIIENVVQLKIYRIYSSFIFIIKNYSDKTEIGMYDIIVNIIYR